MIAGFLVALTFATTIENLQVKEAPLQDPFPEPERQYYTATFETTAYCACAQCCGKSDGITASGTYATQGRTIAAPSNYAFGTEIEINGNVYVVEDRGGAIKGNRIDIFFDSHSEANNYGRRTIEGKVYY